MLLRDLVAQTAREFHGSSNDRGGKTRKKQTGGVNLCPHVPNQHRPQSLGLIHKQFLRNNVKNIEEIRFFLLTTVSNLRM